MDLVLAFRIEAAQSVEALQAGSGIGSLRMNGHCTEWHDVAVHDLELGWVSVLDSGEFEEVAESKTVTIDLHPCHRFQQRDVFRLHKIRATDEDAAWPIEQPRL